MASKQDDNFDLYDDPYVATGANGGADPYAEDDDDYYHSSHGGDQNRDGGYDDAAGKDGARSRFQGRDAHETGAQTQPEERDVYGHQKSQQNQHRPLGDSQGASDLADEYDPAEPYHHRDTPYQQQQQQQQPPQQQQQQQQLSQYNNQGLNYNTEGAYNQQLRQQQQPQAQSTSSGGREHGKMFIGGLNWETTDESLKNYFSRYGELTDCMVMKDPMTNKSRGFGFLTFLDPKHVDAVLKEDHYLDGKMIDPKRAIPREEQEKTEKIFVGGIAADVTEEEFANYFSQFGHVLDATLMLDRATGRPRGFGFITFESDRGVEAALSRRDLMLHDKAIEVKRAQPKHRADSRGAGAGFNAGGFGGAQGGYGGYGAGQGGYGNNIAGGGRNYGMDSMGAMMGAGGFGAGFGGGAGGADPYQAMGAYAAAAARYGANPAAAAAAAALAQRYRMAAAAAAAAYGGAGGAGAGGAGAGMGSSAGGGGYDPTVALSAFYRQQFGFSGAGTGGNQGGSGGGQGYGSNNGGGYGEQESGGGGQSSQRRYGSQSGSDGASAANYNNGGGSSSYGSNSGFESRGGGGGYGTGRGSSSGPNSGRQAGSGSGSGGPVRGSGGSSGSGSGGGSGSSSSGGHGRGGGSYHPYQR
ncbi:hypothetical protein BGZ79_001009 [Entomortierella chlamydospora]|nr:hypothetical protein BGZ79_001009 [Entomortierella chlamydospora]